MLSVEEMRKVGKAIPKGLKANLRDAGKTPRVSYNDLYAMGFKVINYSGLLQRTAIKGNARVLEILKREGTTASA